MAWPAIGSDRAAHLQSLLFQLEQTQWLPPERLRERQLIQLRALLRHVRKTVPHYAGILSGLDIDALDWEGFTLLPLLSRRELQDGFDVLTSRHPPAAHGMVSVGQSSGSTGTPVRYRGTALNQLMWEAFGAREHLWHRRDFSKKLAAIRITTDPGEHDSWGPPASQIWTTGPAVTEHTDTPVDRQLAWLVRHAPAYLITHPSNLAALADISLKNGVSLPGLIEARTSGELVTRELREQVRKAWAVPVVDAYSASEVGAIAFQCPQHEHYHVQSESLIVEILDDAQNACKEGQTGEVVITALHNFAMPLIRYRIGDYAEVGSPCTCGRGLPVIRRVLGRQRNMLVLPNGDRLWPGFPAHLWRRIAPVRQFQLVQHRLDAIEVRFVMDRELTTAERGALQSALREKLRYPFELVFVRLDSIPRSASGKFEDFLSLIEPA